MKYLDKLQPGLTVELVVSEGVYKGNYHSKLDETGIRIFSVIAPYTGGAVLPLQEGMKLAVVFYEDDSAYTLETKVVQRIAIPVPLFVLEMPAEIKRIQRRNFVRVPAFYPVSYQRVDRQGLSDEKKADMLDLSGGGMKFLTREAMDKNSLLYAHLFLPSGEFTTPAKVCRVVKQEELKRWEVSVEFYDIRERERDRIIRCVFDLQRQMRKKGLE